MIELDAGTLLDPPTICQRCPVKCEVAMRDAEWIKIYLLPEFVLLERTATFIDTPYLLPDWGQFVLYLRQAFSSGSLVRSYCCDSSFELLKCGLAVIT